MPLNYRRRRRYVIWSTVILFYLTTGFFHTTLEVHHRDRAAVISEEAGEMVTLKVMTFNIRHAKGLDGRVDLEAVIREIKEIDPDIVALQEVDRYNVRSGFIDQISRLGDALEMNWAFAPALSVLAVEYGNAVLSKYPIVSGQVTMLPGKGEPRNALQVQLDVNGQLLRVWNTHFGISPEAIKRQFPAMFEITNQYTEPYIVMGDFNTSEQQAFMYDALSWKHIAFDEATHQSGKQLDHIFLSEHFTVIDRKIVHSTASDHDPVTAAVAMKRTVR